MRPGILDIFKIIARTQHNLYMLHTQTNGILTHKLTRDILAVLALRPRLFVLTLSIDGPPALHNKLRGIKNNWQDSVATYKALQKYISNRFACYFGMTLSDYNAGQIEATYQSLKTAIPTLSRHDMHFNVAHRSSHYYGNQNSKFSTPQTIAGEIADFNKKKGRRWDGVSILDSLYQRRVASYLETHKTPIPCKALTSSLFLDPDGTIYPCSMWNLALGNVKDISYDLSKFWQSPVAVKTRHVIDLKKCPNCWTPCEAYQSLLGNLPRSMI